MLNMNYRARIYYSETDEALMWDRWQNSESLDYETPAERFNQCVTTTMISICLGLREHKT
jgi:hypothetical protein